MTQREDVRTPFVAGNWKMHMLRSEARTFAEALAGRIDELDEVDLAVAPTFTSLSEVADLLAPLGVGVLGQNGHAAPQGAFTGEVSMTMLVDAGATGVLLGHSERRQYFGEDDEALSDKVPAALAAGLEPILCVGETGAERESGETARRLTVQVTRALANIATVQLPGLTVAYEPVWAIGTGLTATPDLAQEAHAHIRSVLAGLLRRRVGRGGADPVRGLDEARERGRAARPARHRRRADRRRVPGRRRLRGDRRGRHPARLMPLVALVILDGFGLAPAGPGNAVELARTPVFDDLWARFPHTTLAASGRAVGLPDGQMGNSEVGHLTIGAGRHLHQDLVRLSDAVADGSFADNPALVAAARRAKAAGSRLHVMGLVSDGGVHSHVDHLRALVGMAQREGVVAHVHAITDGRDVSPHQAAGLLATLEDEWAGGEARFATVCGRIYAMDRDSRWERTEQYYRAVVDGVGAEAASASQAVAAAYEAGVTDEFVEPAVIDRDGLIRAGDELIFFNFRPDRARQVCAALADPAFAGFDRGPAPPLPALTTMTTYWTGQPGTVAFAPEWPARGAGRRARRTPASASCTRPRRRSTRTSRTS